MVTYFHAVSRARRIKNTLTSIQDETGVIHRGQSNISKVAENYFNNLFSSTNDVSMHFEQTFQGFSQRVTSDMNEDLTRDITEEEVQITVFDIGPHKAPGPDGFTGAFYHQHWEDVKTELMSEIKRFFTDDDFDDKLIQTNICLIPKVYPPTGMSEFRPIALCNVIYKVISKILINRLKKHLSSVITENQAAFIPDRMISDNRIVAHEVFQSQSKETTGGFLYGS